MPSLNSPQIILICMCHLFLAGAMNDRHPQKWQMSYPETFMSRAYSRTVLQGTPHASSLLSPTVGFLGLLKVDILQ